MLKAAGMKPQRPRDLCAKCVPTLSGALSLALRLALIVLPKQYAFHLVHRALLHVGQHVRIRVERQPDAGTGPRIPRHVAADEVMASDGQGEVRPADRQGT